MDKRQGHELGKVGQRVALLLVDDRPEVRILIGVDRARKAQPQVDWELVHS